MDSKISHREAETNEDIFAFDVPDDVLERSADSTNGRAITFGFCTYAVWYCGWAPIAKPRTGAERPRFSS